MRRCERDQTRSRHYLIAIGWFAAAGAIWSDELARKRRFEMERRIAIAEAEAKAAATGEPARISSRFFPDSICCDWGIGRRELKFHAVPHKLLFAVAGVLMFWNYHVRLAGLILGMWSAGIWILQHWLLVSPRGDWLN
jgi:hypothetical protein